MNSLKAKPSVCNRIGCYGTDYFAVIHPSIQKSSLSRSIYSAFVQINILSSILNHNVKSM